MSPLAMGLLKWALALLSIILNFVIFGEIGIVFGLALAYVFITKIE